jgi:hypothetical protein
MRTRTPTVPCLFDSMRPAFLGWLAREAGPQDLYDLLGEGALSRPPLCHGGERYLLSGADLGLVRDELLLRVGRAGGRLKLHSVTVTSSDGQLKIELS